MAMIQGLFVAELIPVIIFETLIRCYWFYKQKFIMANHLKRAYL